MIDLFVILVVFTFGLVIGSFLNVVIYRSIHGESPAKGRSYCPQCGHQIRWYDNIPLLSYVLLRGQCRDCRQQISVQYPIVEFLTGALFVWWFVIGSTFFRLTQTDLQIIQPLFWLLIGVLLLIIFIVDLQYMIIPDYASLGIALLAIGYRLYLAFSGIMQWSDVRLACIAGVVNLLFFLTIFIATKGRGMGFGDVKFSLVMGLLLGWQRTIVAVFAAFITGSIVGSVLLLTGKKRSRQHIPFGPFLVLGTAVALLWGNDIFTWYVSLL